MATDTARARSTSPWRAPVEPLTAMASPCRAGLASSCAMTGVVMSYGSSPKQMRLNARCSCRSPWMERLGASCPTSLTSRPRCFAFRRAHPTFHRRSRGSGSSRRCRSVNRSACAGMARPGQESLQEPGAGHRRRLSLTGQPGRPRPPANRLKRVAGCPPGERTEREFRERFADEPLSQNARRAQYRAQSRWRNGQRNTTRLGGSRCACKAGPSRKTGPVIGPGDGRPCGAGCGTRQSAVVDVAYSDQAYLGQSRTREWGRATNPLVGGR